MYLRGMNRSSLPRNYFARISQSMSTDSHFATRRKKCKRYIQHVLFLCRMWQTYKFEPNSDGEFQPFLELSTACGWYLMESGAWSEEFELMAVAMEQCEDKEGLIYSHLCNSYGIVEMERAHADAALLYMTKSLEIRQKLLPADHEELANLYNNFGNMILQDYKENTCQECIDYQLKAIEIDMTKPETERNLILHIRHANIGRTLTLLGNHEKAEWYIEQARKYILANFGPETHRDATCDYYRGNISYSQNRVQEARRYWTRAAELFAKDNVSHPTTIATKMKLACLDSQERRYKEAILTLEHLILVSKLTEGAKGDQGQTARIMRRLADVYIADGNVSKGESLKKAAEAIRAEIQGTRFATLPDNEMSYKLLVYHSFW